VDQQLDPPSREALLRREVASLGGLNHELRGQMERAAADARRKSEQDHKLALSLQSEVEDLRESNCNLVERNNHLLEKIKAMSADMKDLDIQCQEKERLCLKNESDLGALESFKNLTESLTRDNTDLLCELDKIQSFVQKGMSNDESLNKEKAILLAQLQNSDSARKKNIELLRAAETANTDLMQQNDTLANDLAEITSNFRVAELELQNLRSRVLCEVLDEVSQETTKIHSLEAENAEYRQKEHDRQAENDTYKTENTRLNAALSEQSTIVQRLSVDGNVETVKKLSKTVIDLTVERDECKSRLSDKHALFLSVESKLIDEQKALFQLTMVADALKDDKRRAEAHLEATTNDYNRKVDILTANNSKLSADFDDLTERCSGYKAQLRGVEEDARNEYETRLQERRDFNATRLELEDSMSRERASSKTNQCRIETLEREQEALKEKMEQERQVSASLLLKKNEMEELAQDTNALLLSEERKNKMLAAEVESLESAMTSLKTSSAGHVQESQDRIEELQHALTNNKTKLHDALQQMKEKKKTFRTNALELNESLQDADARCKSISDEVSKLQHTVRFAIL
jgi:chromosome segregation ATPase